MVLYLIEIMSLKLFCTKSNLFWAVGGSPGLVVMGGDSCSKGLEFESWHCILDGHFSHSYLL